MFMVDSIQISKLGFLNIISKVRRGSEKIEKKQHQADNWFDDFYGFVIKLNNYTTPLS